MIHIIVELYFVRLCIYRFLVFQLFDFRKTPITFEKRRKYTYRWMSILFFLWLVFFVMQVVDGLLSPHVVSADYWRNERIFRTIHLCCITCAGLGSSVS